MTEVKLTEQEIASVRERVSTSHMRRKFYGPVERVRFRDGPLDGITAIVEAGTSRSEYFGWCIVTPKGPVQVLYRPSGEPGVARFAHLVGGPR